MCQLLIALLALLAVGAGTPARAQSDPAQVGQWSERQSWPDFAIHAHLLPTGKVAFWSDIAPFDVDLWDPETNTFTVVPGPGYIHYCTGHSFLANGQLLVAGGHVVNHVGLPDASLFDPFTETWIPLPDMNNPRWYPTVTTLANGDLVVVLGSINVDTANFVPQVWETAATPPGWRDLTAAVAGSPGVNYPWLFVAPNGQIFIAGHGQPTKYLDTSGTGAWSFLTNTIAADRDFGSAVMYEPGKVLIMGGDGDINNEPPRDTAEVIDLNLPSPAWRQVGSLSGPRRQLNATLLPDGTVLVTGGSSATGFNDSSAPVCHAEVWNPDGETWTTLATNPTCTYRGYHSVALLLPDGRVLTAGGTNFSSFANAEFFWPPYLFRGPRPTITSTRSVVTYNQTFFVGTPDAANVARVTWVRLSSVTHAYNQNQRFNELTFTAAEGGVNVTTPGNEALSPPGHYLLFLLNANGVPSIGKMIRIEAATGLAPAAPLDLAATAVSGSQIDLAWTDNASNEEGFLIERSVDGATFREVAVVAANTTGYSDSGLSLQTTYSYRVRAYNLAGESAHTNVAPVTTFGIPAAPSGLAATAVSGTQIDLSWTDNASDEESVRLERSLDASSYTEIASVAANLTSYSDASLSPGTTYHHRVRACNVVGCSTYSNVATATTFAPAVTLSPTTLSFSEQRVGTTSAPRTLTLTNSGTALLNITSITITGDFAQTSTCASSLAPAASCTINVTFTPTATGARAGTLALADNAPGSPHSVALSGTGIQPAVTLSPTSLVFANQLVGTTSTPQTVTLTNSGTASLNLTSITITGDFAQTHNCPLAPTTLGAAASCTIDVTFTPTAAGTRAGSLTITDDASGSPHTVSLSGTGVQPALTFSSSTLVFQDQLVGTTSAAQSLTLTNSGTAALTISGISISGDFAQTHTCPLAPATLAPSTGCTLQVTFSPTATGARTGTLTIVHDAPGSPSTVTLTGTGIQPAVTLSTTSLSFGGQLVGTTSSAQGITLTNSGNATLNLTSIGVTGDFAQTNDCPVSLAAGTSCTISVNFTPTMTDTRTGTLTIEDDAPGSPHLVNLTGTGIQPAVTLSTTSLSFSGQLVVTTSSAQGITLTNSGTATLNIGSISVTGDFAQTNNCPLAPATLAASISCTLQVTFSPTATGTRNGTLTIAHDAPGSPYTVSLSGSGTQPTVTLSTASLVFRQRLVGTTSSTQGVTLTSSGTATLNIGSITITGDFAQTNNCPISMAAGASCTINVTFTPIMSGPRAGTLTIEDDAPGSPHVINLAGTGIQPAVSLSTASLVFPNQLVGTTSSLQSLTLTNSGTATLNISEIAISGDFSQNHTCPASLGATLACSISVTFTPTMTGTRTGTLTIEDDAPGSPHSVELSGTGTLVAVAPASLPFGDQLVGTTSSAQVVTVTNTGADPLNIVSITTSGDFAQSNACPANLGSGAECTINVTFSPTAPGSREGTLTIEDDAPGSPRTVALSGSGTHFTLSVSPGASTSVTVTAGGTATYKLTIVPGGFQGSLSFNCTGAPPGASCTVSPNPAALNGSTPVEVTVTVTTTARSVAVPAIRQLPPGWFAPMLLAAMLAWLILRSPALARRQRRWATLAPASAGLEAVLLVLLAVSCGGGGGTNFVPRPPSIPTGGTPPGTSTITVAATSGNLTSSINLTLTVN